jgi:hypothetical protein
MKNMNKFQFFVLNAVTGIVFLFVPRFEIIQGWLLFSIFGSLTMEKEVR